MRFSPWSTGSTGRDRRLGHPLSRRPRPAQRRDVIILSVGDPDFDTPAAITDATIAALRPAIRITAIAGLEELRAAIAKRSKARTGQSTTLDNVAVMAGAQCGLFSPRCACSRPATK
jgi:arginine:pyruvate transaminase